MRRAAAVVLGLYAAYAAAMVWLHPRLIYPFDPEPFALAGYEVTEILAVPGPVTVSVANAGGKGAAVLFFMGNTGSLARFPTATTAYRDRGDWIVALQYPGGGGVPGAPSEALLKAQALAAYDWFAAQTDDPIHLHGYSLGSALALHVAARRDVAGVMLDAPFARMCDLMARQSALPACYLPGVQRWDSLDDVADIKSPVQIRHGDADTLIPMEDGARLAQAMRDAGIEVSFHAVPGGTHNNIFRTDGYWDRVAAFLTR